MLGGLLLKTAFLLLTLNLYVLMYIVISFLMKLFYLNFLNKEPQCLTDPRRAHAT